MGSVLQFAVFLSIGWLIRNVVTHPNQNEDKILNIKQSDRNGPGFKDFYFDEQKATEDNVKTGRSISQSAWSKEDKEQVQTVENKTGTQFSDEFSLKNAISYFLNMLYEMKEDIIGIKEMTHLKNTKNLTHSQENSENKVKQNKMGENNDTLKPDTSTKNTQFERKNQKHKSDYVADYYKNNGNKYVDDDLETSSDESDDSSHNLNEGTSIHEISKIKHDACISECSTTKRKPDKYSSKVEETTAISMSQTEIPEENYKKFDNTKDDDKDDFKESTKKHSAMKLNTSKTSREKTKNIPSSKTGKCFKKNNTSNNLNEKNEPTKKLLNSAEYATSSSQDKHFNKEHSKRPNQNKISDKVQKMTSSLFDSRSSGEYSKNKADMDIDSKSGIRGQSTTLSSQSSNDVIYPENIENKPNASEISPEKLTYQKKQEQITSLKQKDQEQTRNNAKPLKNNEKKNEYSTVSLQSHEIENEISNHEMRTDTKIIGRPKEYKGKRLNVHSPHTTIAYSEIEPNSKSDGPQTSNSFDISITILPATSGNNINTENLSKNPSGNLNGKRGSNHPQLGRNESEIQRFSETEQGDTQKLNSDSEPEKSLKNNKLSDTNGENNNKEEDDKLASMTTNNLPSPQDPNREIQNYDVEGSDKPQEAQENIEGLNKKDGVRDISLDQEYEEDYEDFEISDEITDVENEDIEMNEDFNKNEEDELITKNRNEEDELITNNRNEEDELITNNRNEEDELITNNKNEENNDEKNLGNTANVLRNESQISQHTGYFLERKSQEQYNTYLEYLYKHSNNPFFKSLKSQSNNLSQ